MTIDTTQRNVITIDTTGLERAVEEYTELRIVHFLRRSAETCRGHEDFAAAIVCASLADLIRRGAYREGV